MMELDRLSLPSKNSPKEMKEVNLQLCLQKQVMILKKEHYNLLLKFNNDECIKLNANYLILYECIISLSLIIIIHILSLFYLIF